MQRFKPPQQAHSPGLSTADLRNAKIVGKACEDWLRKKGLLGQFNLCGNLREVQADIDKEAKDYLAAELMKYALPKILRGASRGLPEWYKEHLAQGAFSPSKEAMEAALA